MSEADVDGMARRLRKMAEKKAKAAPTKRGGARPGAGRPPAALRTVRAWTVLPVDVAAELMRRNGGDLAGALRDLAMAAVLGVAPRKRKPK